MKIIYFFLPMIIFLGVITSYQDFKYGKIKNKWIILALIYSLVVNFGLTMYFWFGNSLNIGYIKDWAINGLISLILGFLLWNFRFWSAGDAKLFFAYSWLIPLTAYSRSYVRYFPSLIILINTFVPYALFLFIKALFSLNKKNLKNLSKDINLKTFGIMFLSFFGIHWIVRYFSNFLKIGDVFTNYLITFCIYFLLNKIVPKKKEKLYIGVLVSVLLLRFLIDKEIYSLSFWKSFLGFTLFFKFIRTIISIATKNFFIKEIPIDKLKEGMFLANGIKKVKGKYQICELKESIIGKEPWGLTKKEIKFIKKNKNKFGFKKIKILETMPFAPIIFLGVILTLIAKGSFILIFK